MAPLCSLPPHPLASSPLWPLPLLFSVPSPFLGSPSGPVPLLKNYILTPETVGSHPWPRSPD
ncbi:hypothetical protein I79_014357 [Cricetulus griseus]|uniref:Uncharacterized protein n=1 Tax=Cricetulus griseus TaxID=10029 RepID=G3HTX7_CRIGR|nr:hypothetical protein I79_014357 [Cricetulus griseus]